MKTKHLVAGGFATLLSAALVVGGHWLYRAHQTDAKARNILSFFSNVQKHMFAFPCVMTKDGKSYRAGLIRTPDGLYSGVVLKQADRNNITMDLCPMRMDSSRNLEVDASRRPMRMDYHDDSLSVVGQSLSGHLTHMSITPDGPLGLAGLEMKDERDKILFARVVLNGLSCDEGLEILQARRDAGRFSSVNVGTPVPPDLQPKP